MNSLERYLVFVTKGYKDAGYTSKDIAAKGGLMKLQGELHCDAAYELMDEDSRLTFELARIKVRSFVEECARKCENNSYDYSPH